ncbi:MAG: thioredoxin family protein [Thalassovita sp.]
MKRREFMVMTAALGAAPLSAFAAPLDYVDGLVKARLAAGETVFLDFKASWCNTCAAQERVLEKLRAENPAYDANITFVNVDWDQYGRSKLTKGLRVPRRSTLIVLKGDQELGRIIADTSPTRIKALVDTALNAATSA